MLRTLPTGAHPLPGARRSAVALLIASALVTACGENPQVVRLQARNDSLATAVEELTSLSDSLAETLRRTTSENERLVADVEFWQAQSEGWRVIVEGGPPVSPERRR